VDLYPQQTQPKIPADSLPQLILAPLLNYTPDNKLTESVTICLYMAVDHTAILITIRTCFRTVTSLVAGFRDGRHNRQTCVVREYIGGSCGTQPASLCRELPGRS